MVTTATTLAHTIMIVPSSWLARILRNRPPLEFPQDLNLRMYHVGHGGRARSTGGELHFQDSRGGITPGGGTAFPPITQASPRDPLPMELVRPGCPRERRTAESNVIEALESYARIFVGYPPSCTTPINFSSYALDCSLGVGITGSIRRPSFMFKDDETLGGSKPLEIRLRYKL